MKGDTKMDNWKKEFISKLREERTSYADMIDFCCDSLILNNSIQCASEKCGCYFYDYCGNSWDEEADECVEWYQQFIISENDADRLAEYTNELVMYCEELDLYLLCVTHYGTMWSGVPANWKSESEIKN